MLELQNELKYLLRLVDETVETDVVLCSSSMGDNDDADEDEVGGNIGQ
jgi:hypothetical protein